SGLAASTRNAAGAPTRCSTRRRPAARGEGATAFVPVIRGGIYCGVSTFAHNSVEGFTMFRRNMIGGLLLAIAMAIPLDARGVNSRNPFTPLTRDGKPDLSAPVPKAADGKPDLSGMWLVQPTPLAELTRMFGDIASSGALGDDPATFSKYVFSITSDFKP